jgi:hypothetical protein
MTANIASLSDVLARGDGSGGNGNTAQHRSERASTPGIGIRTTSTPDAEEMADALL